MFASSSSSSSSRFMMALLSAALVALLALAGLQPAAAGRNKGNKGKGGEEDIILYRGNIVLRGDKSGGSIVMADNHPTHEEVEFSPSFFGGAGGQAFGEMAFRRRR